MSQLPEQPFSMADGPFLTKRWPLNPQLLPTPETLRHNQPESIVAMDQRPTMR